MEMLTSVSLATPHLLGYGNEYMLHGTISTSRRSGRDIPGTIIAVKSPFHQAVQFRGQVTTTCTYSGFSSHRARTLRGEKLPVGLVLLTTLHIGLAIHHVTNSVRGTSGNVSRLKTASEEIQCSALCVRLSCSLISLSVLCYCLVGRVATPQMIWRLPLLTAW